MNPAPVEDSHGFTIKPKEKLLPLEAELAFKNKYRTQKKDAKLSHIK